MSILKVDFFIFSIVFYQLIIYNTVKRNEVTGMSESEFNAIFSKRLKYFLNKYEMTQSELAKRLGVSTQSVTNWCKGAKSPRMDKVDAMCEIFHCKRSDFMEDEDFDTKPTTLAAHFSSDEYTVEELEEIKKFAEFVKSRRK